MKSNAIVIIVAAIIIVGGIGYLAYSNPSLFTGSKSSTPQTLSGMNVVSTNTVNSSMGGKWYEGYNVTGGLSNISNLQDLFSGIGGSNGGIGMQTINNSAAQLRYFQFAGFGTPAHNGSLLFGYMEFSAVNYTKFINETLSKNASYISNTHGNYVHYGIVSGAAYEFVSNKTMNGYYENAIYAVYGKNIIAGFYIGSANISEGNFTSLVSSEVSILKSQPINFTTAEKLVQSNTVNSAMSATTWSSDFNFSVNFMRSTGMLGNLINSTSPGTFGSDLYLANESYSNVTGLGLSAFSNGSNGALLLGYLGARDSTLAANAYENLSNNGKSSSSVDGYVNGTNTSGMKYFNITFPSGYGLPRSSIYIGLYQSYLIFEVYTGTHVSNSSLLSILDAESVIL
ncbi:MAG: hypothetical protein M1464_01215 [Candidatus Thermoplasmatota archaeon]|nr:hypothetical protein [Candidatus Thermoplasmatota archaeon]